MTSLDTAGSVATAVGLRIATGFSLPPRAGRAAAPPKGRVHVSGGGINGGKSTQQFSLQRTARWVRASQSRAYSTCGCGFFECNERCEAEKDGGGG
jgi:hypothetical protein